MKPRDGYQRANKNKLLSPSAKMFGWVDPPKFLTAKVLYYTVLCGLASRVVSKIHSYFGYQISDIGDTHPRQNPKMGMMLLSETHNNMFNIQSFVYKCIK